MSDGSEAQELFQSNIFEISRLQGKLNLSKAGETDAYRQTRESFALLGECRDLLEIVWDTEMHDAIQELIAKIDAFYPKGEYDED